MDYPGNERKLKRQHLTAKKTGLRGKQGKIMDWRGKH
jgi:hypothetical protein